MTAANGVARRQVWVLGRHQFGVAGRTEPNSVGSGAALP